MKNGINIIAQEREEQIKKHGKTIIFDVKNNNEGELIDAALALLMCDFDLLPEKWDEKIKDHLMEKTYAERITIAGALLAAELDRLHCVELTKYVRCPNT